MIVLADNDILLKLAQCDLFAEFLAAFEVTAADVFVLPRSRRSLTSPSRRRRLGAGSYARLDAFLTAVGDVAAEPDPAAVDGLTELQDIDAGEAVLFAVCPRVPAAVVATGDKRSLEALHAASAVDPTAAAVCAALAGRVYCFEQVIDRVLARFGFAAVRDRLVRGRECDGGLRLWLGSGLEPAESAFADGLRSYLADARRRFGSLLCG